MHVALVDSVPLSFGGGYEAFILEFAESLTHAGHQVTIVTPPDALASLYYSALSATFKRFHSSTTAIPFRVVRCGPIALRKVLREADVIYVKNEPHELMMAIPAAADVPVVVGFHSAVERPGQPSWNPRRRIYGSSAYGSLLRQATKIHTLQAVQARWCSHIHSVPPDRVQVVPNGVNTARFTPASADEEGVFRLLFVGRLDHQKAIDTVLAAMDLVRQSVPHQVSLTVVGDGPLSGRVEAAAKAHSDVQYLGRKDDMPSIYRQHDALVAPSRWEMFAFVPLEALACGLPVIAGNTEASSPFQGEMTTLVDPDDAGALAHVIESWLAEKRNRPDLWNAKRSAGRALVESSFESRRVHAHLIEVIEGALPGPRAAFEGETPRSGQASHPGQNQDGNR